jgi:hypothetical protein
LFPSRRLALADWRGRDRSQSGPAKKLIPAPSRTQISTVSCCTRGRCSRKRSIPWQQGQSGFVRLRVPGDRRTRHFATRLGFALLCRDVRDRLNATGIAKEPALGTAPPLLYYPSRLPLRRPRRSSPHFSTSINAGSLQCIYSLEVAKVMPGGRSCPRNTKTRDCPGIPVPEFLRFFRRDCQRRRARVWSMLLV